MVSYFRDEIAGGGVPTFSGAAAFLGVGNVEMREWVRSSHAFREAYAECRLMLADHLIQGGLVKRYDASLVKVMLAELGREDPLEEGGADGEHPSVVTVRIVGAGENGSRADSGGAH